MCHHPKRFSEDCVDFNMHEEKEIKESEKLMQKGLDVTDFCKPIDPSIAQCIADHSWEMLGEDEKPVPNDLEEAAEKSLRLAGFHNMETRGMDWKGGFIAGYKYRAEHTPLPEDTVLFNKGVEEGKRLMMEEMSECFAQLKQVQSESINMSAVREQLAYNRGASDERYKMRKKMMKEAVEGEILLTPYPTICLDDCKDYDFKDGQKVRVIVLPKEDEK